MIYLLLAILSSAMVSVVMRLSEGRVNAKTGMLAVNYVICLLVAGSYMGFNKAFLGGDGFSFAVSTGFVNGFLYLAGFVLLQMNVKKNGVVLSSIFMRLGLLVPMVISMGLFGEMPTMLQAIGFVIAVSAIILINFESSKSSVSFKMGLILLLLSGGCADGMSKIYEEMGNSAFEEQFLFYTFFSALILCLALMVYKKEHPQGKDILFGALIGIPNYFSARFLLKSLDAVPAVIAYPTYSVATIAVVTLAGRLMFKEYLSKKQQIAVLMIMTALALLNI